MKKCFGMMCVFVLVCYSAIQAQESKVKFDVYGGISSPLDSYKSPIGRAKGGYFTGVSLDYYFVEGMIGLGLDARFAEHKHSPLDTITVDNATLFSSYSTSERFRYKGIFIGPTFQSYIGRMGIEFYAKGGVVAQQMPLHDRNMLFFMGSNLISAKAFTTMHQEKSSAFAVIGGFRINYKITDWLGLFMMGDYQDHLSSQGYEIKKLQSQFNYPASETPEGTAKIKMMNFGMGLKFMFGGGGNWDTLSEF